MKKLQNNVFLMIFIGLVISNVSHADPATRDTITKYYSIAPTAMVPNTSDRAFERRASEVYPTNYVPALQGFGAPLYLPDSARIVEFKVWATDTDGAIDIMCSLLRFVHNQHGPPGDIIARVYSSGSSGFQELTDTIIEYSVIDNINYKYSIALQTEASDSSHMFHSARIKYEITTTGVYESQGPISPVGMSDIQSYPVPFSDYSIISYHVPKTSRVIAKKYDEAGRVIRTMFDNTMKAGSYTARWDGNNDKGEKVAAGTYFCFVKTNGSSTTKVVHIK